MATDDTIYAEDGDGRIEELDLADEMRSSYLDYAMSVIVGRALPDVRDGLKPVHRRVLYAMNGLGLQPNRPYVKCSRVVGDTMGLYHPHGDASIYDTLVRLAQPFASRMPLVDGQGNFGSIDGWPAAAMRYTESRLAPLAMEMIRDLDADTVDFGPNYDGSTTQPLSLPARFPNLLVNGSSGIAVGMATNIPPHNLGEAIDAVVAMIDDPDVSVERLLEVMPGPDFPTGAEIRGTAGIREAYETGRGRVRVRAKAEVEELSNGRTAIVVTELPYTIRKGGDDGVIAKIAQLANDKVLPEIADIRDESSHRVGMRIVIVLKRDAVPTVVLNKLYKHTPLQSTFGVYMLALVDNVPRVLGLRDILRHYIAHQKDVITRRTRYMLDRAEKRAHVLEGYLVALEHLDAVIELIRRSADAEAARTGLQETFSLSEIQAQAILDLRLQRLTNMGQDEIRGEHAELVRRISELRGILGDERRVYGLIRDEILDVKAAHADPRRTAIVPDDGEIDHEATIPDEDMVISLTSTGYVKRVPLDEYRAQRRGGRGRMGMRTKDEDWIAHLFVASAHDYVLFFSSRGKVYRVKAWQLPLANLQARGRPIVNFLPLTEGERIMSVFRTRDFSEGRFLVMSTRQGMVKKTEFTAYDSRAAVLNAISIRDDDELVDVRLADDHDEILLVSRDRMAARFPASEIRATGRDTMGVIGMRLDPDDAVVAIRVPRPDADILVVTEDGVGKRTPFAGYRLTHRGARGVLTMKKDGKGGGLVGALAVSEGDDVMVITEGGIITRMAVDEIRRTESRTTQGVIVQKVPEGDRIAAIALVPEAEEAEVSADAETSLEEALEQLPDDTGGPFDAPGVVPPEDLALGAGVGEPPEEVAAALDDSEAGSASDELREGEEPDGA
jgi:DNA gyrase subunit A